MFTLEESVDFESDFKRSLRVNVNEITEYSHPKRNASEFNQVFTRYEVLVNAGLPCSWSNTESVKNLLREMWDFGFEFASYLSE